ELRSLAELSLQWPDTHSVQTDHQTLAIVLHMKSVIDRLLAIARGEQGGSAAQLEKVDLLQLMADIRRSLDGRASARQITLEWKMAAGLEIITDQVLLRSIASNLLENAVEYAPERASVHVGACAKGVQFNLTISNPAEHLRPDDLAHLFDRFWRKDNA